MAVRAAAFRASRLRCTASGAADGSRVSYSANTVRQSLPTMSAASRGAASSAGARRAVVQIQPLPQRSPHFRRCHIAFSKSLFQISLYSPFPPFLSLPLRGKVAPQRRMRGSVSGASHKRAIPAASPLISQRSEPLTASPKGKPRCLNSSPPSTPLPARSSPHQCGGCSHRGSGQHLAGAGVARILALAEFGRRVRAARGSMTMAASPCSHFMTLPHAARYFLRRTAGE